MNGNIQLNSIHTSRNSIPIEFQVHIAPHTSEAQESSVISGIYDNVNNEQREEILYKIVNLGYVRKRLILINNAPSLVTATASYFREAINILLTLSLKQNLI